MDDLEIAAAFLRIVELAKRENKISETCYDALINLSCRTLDELEDAARDLLHAVIHHEYYLLLDRIRKGEEFINTETDESKKKRYQEGLTKLVKQLELLKPA